MLFSAKKFNKVVDDLSMQLERQGNEVLEDKVEEIKELIMDNYETLTLYRIGRDSQLELRDFYDDFKEFLDEYLYLETESGSISLSVPDVDALEESKVEKLKVVLVAIEGLGGRYVELTDKELQELGLSRSNSIGFVINNKNVYLYRRTRALEIAMKAANIRIRRWPFSAPRNIFREAESYLDDNMRKWLKEIIKKATLSLKQEYK